RNRRAGLCRLLMKRGVLRRGEDLGADEETAQAYEVGELKVLPSLGERPYSLEREQNRFGTDFSARERAVLSEDALDFVPKEALRARVWNREFAALKENLAELTARIGRERTRQRTCSGQPLFENLDRIDNGGVPYATNTDRRCAK